ncbi:DUF4276 family protein [Luteolibacter arcticus]|uniref:DUF4276 family protein n=1 Tax=Luteolibacter arcticus TaxID=1581411 RepID=A0ABT3GQW1_9BACT|nr:DUF4276 family protein [Luteolibacter arcticus]MCW1925848.1 DUF4276 family protein [Luteolibacter arcticus]
MKIKLYIEGGGNSQLQDTQFREGWRKFFENAGLKTKMPATFRGGGRDQTFDDYKTAVKNRKPDVLPLLLVDSEDLVAAGETEWDHLKSRDDWERPEKAGGNDAYLMVTCMETWFLADREALKKFFHDCWRDNAVPKWADLESVPKVRVFEALAKATAGCGEKGYAKGKRSFEILKVIDPAEVEAKCPGAKRLLDRLRNP